MKCRFCGEEVRDRFIDLNHAPPSNSYLNKEQLNEPEVYYPLSVHVCTSCWLVQVDEYKKSNEIFNKDYAYFSSFSRSWLKHAEMYCDMITEMLGLNQNSLVVEIASNDGYLLKNFVKKGIPCFGVEPSAGTAKEAEKVGVESEICFLTEQTALELRKKRGRADLVVGNNVLAHVPNINDFVRGLAALLNESGVVTLEFPHLLNLIKENQFDTIYHEHFSYLSLTTVLTIFRKHGLYLFDVEELPTHGGSLRLYCGHKANSLHLESSRVNDILERERVFGLTGLKIYSQFQEKINLIKYQFLEFLLKNKREGKKVAAYGAAAKGNTLLNYCGITSDLIEFVVDASPFKKGLYLPGSHIPIVDESLLKQEKPDIVIIFPWNIADEIRKQIGYVESWGGKLVIVIPSLTVLGG